MPPAPVAPGRSTSSAAARKPERSDRSPVKAEGKPSAFFVLCSRDRGTPVPQNGSFGSQIRKRQGEISHHLSSSYQNEFDSVCFRSGEMEFGSPRTATLEISASDRKGQPQ